MKKKISLEEQKRIQLEMLIEFDEICKKNDIKYSLSYGTLLGAIRHKGFIPWDDDVDIMMPMEEIEKLKKIFSSDNMLFCDIDTVKHYAYHFPRIAHKSTYSHDGMIGKSYGVCIDIYPVSLIPRSQDKQDAFFEEGKKLLERRLLLIRWRRLIIKFLPIYNIPFYNKAIRKYRDFMFSYKDNSDSLFFIFSGPITQKNICIFSKDLFSSLTEVEFEKNFFSAISDWDLFLSQSYGNYMQLPPVEKRVPYHGHPCYWK